MIMSNKKYIYINTVLVLVFLFSFNQGANAGSSDVKNTEISSIISYSVNRNSWMALAGTTNINSFQCVAESGISNGVILVDFNPGEDLVNFSDAQLLIDISSFNCQNSRMKRDMYEALGGEENSRIEIKLIEAMLTNGNLSSDGGNFRTNAAITINGHTDTLELIIDWQRYEAMEYRFEGSADLNMSDFGITPPSPFLGLVKVNDEITVRFNYIVHPVAISRLD